MFGPTRFPFRGLALVAIGFAAASILAGTAPGTAAGLGALLVIPLFLFKMFFLFLVFGTFLRFAGGGFGGPRGPYRGGRGHWHHHRRGGDRPAADDPATERDRRDWEESLRQAREELREYDTPFTAPPPGFEPPSEERDG